MKTIWKFELKFEEITKIEIPIGAEILTVQRDEKTNKPCLWAMVETHRQKEIRHIGLFGTGADLRVEIISKMIYLGTFQYQKGAFIGHVFEL